MVPLFHVAHPGRGVLALLNTAGRIAGFYTGLWSHEVRFTSVFVTELQTQLLLGLVTGAVVLFLILYGNVSLARGSRRARPP